MREGNILVVHAKFASTLTLSAPRPAIFIVWLNAPWMRGRPHYLRDARTAACELLNFS